MKEIKIEYKIWKEYVVNFFNTESIGYFKSYVNNLTIELKDRGYLDKETYDLVFNDIFTLYGFFINYIDTFSKKFILVILEQFKMEDNNG